MPPVQVILTSPADNAEIEGNQVTFAWEEIVGVLNYTLYVRKSSDDSLLAHRNVTENEATINNVPRNGEQYYWSVYATNENGDGPESEQRTFLSVEFDEGPFAFVGVSEPALTNKLRTENMDLLPERTPFESYNIGDDGESIYLMGGPGSVPMMRKVNPETMAIIDSFNPPSGYPVEPSHRGYAFVYDPEDDVVFVAEYIPASLAFDVCRIWRLNRDNLEILNYYTVPQGTVQEMIIVGNHLYAIASHVYESGPSWHYHLRKFNKRTFAPVDVSPNLYTVEGERLNLWNLFAHGEHLWVCGGAVMVQFHVSNLATHTAVAFTTDSDKINLGGISSGGHAIDENIAYMVGAARFGSELASKRAVFTLNLDTFEVDVFNVHPGDSTFNFTFIGGVAIEGSHIYIAGRKPYPWRDVVDKYALPFTESSSLIHTAESFDNYIRALHILQLEADPSPPVDDEPDDDIEPAPGDPDPDEPPTEEPELPDTWIPTEDLDLYPAMPRSPISALSGPINAEQTEITVEHPHYFLPAPNVAVIGNPGDTNTETILYTGKDVSQLTGVTRGWEPGGSAKHWSAGTPIARTLTAQDINALQQWIAVLIQRIEDLREICEGGVPYDPYGYDEYPY